MVYDLRNHQVPTPLTVGGMVGAGVYALFNGLWAPVLLMIALTHVSDFNPREKRLAFALTLSAFAAIFQPAATLICLLILVVWVLWEYGVLGGADVVSAITVCLVWPGMLFIISFLVIHLIVVIASGLVSMIREQKNSVHRLPGIPILLASVMFMKISFVFLI